MYLYRKVNVYIGPLKVSFVESFLLSVASLSFIRGSTMLVSIGRMTGIYKSHVWYIGHMTGISFLFRPGISGLTDQCPVHVVVLVNEFHHTVSFSSICHLLLFSLREPF